MKRQFANLNIRYDFPIWDYRVPTIMSKLEGWIIGTQYWFSTSEDEKHVSSSCEPAGLSLYGKMEDDEWSEWLIKFKEVATDILGYKIGEIETGEVGHDFVWIKNELSIFEEYAKLYHEKNPQTVWDIYHQYNDSLTELDEIELEKWLFGLDWHTTHDNIASGFQTRSHPSTAKFLYQKIQSNKIPEFDYKPVSRKCVWALADIGTIEAKEYIVKLSTCEDSIIKDYANKRLENWNNELGRKGRMINCVPFPHKDRIKIKNYSEVETSLPNHGNCISAYQYEDSIVVYQAYKPAIAKFAVENQKFGGSDFSFSRMTWIKPNYLWMMYRSGWAKKENQERILAIRISKIGWEELLKEAVFSSYKSDYYSSETEWRSKLEESEVRLQWDPNHDPYGNKLERKAIQIGIKGSLLKKYNEEMILKISDITPFVNKQSLYVEHEQLQYLEIPDETIYTPIRNDLNVGITDYNISKTMPESSNG